MASRAEGHVISRHDRQNQFAQHTLNAWHLSLSLSLHRPPDLAQHMNCTGLRSTALMIRSDRWLEDGTKGTNTEEMKERRHTIGFA